MAAKVCCDTSFLFALYTVDIHTPAARSALAGAQQPTIISALNDFEFFHAVQLAAFRGLISTTDAGEIMTAFKADVFVGKFRRVACDLSEVVAEAKRLAARHTPVSGDRSFDILHVAAALVMGASSFLSFDAKQRALAMAEGLAVQP